MRKLLLIDYSSAISILLCCCIISNCLDNINADESVPSSTGKENTVCSINNDDPTCTPIGAEKDEVEGVPSECALVMAPSAVSDKNAGWGVFSLIDRRRGSPVAGGDVVIQIPDALQQKQQLMLSSYLSSSEETGGFYEGRSVLSAQPGIGMLANGFTADKKRHNVLPWIPRYDEGGLTRLESPGAGAATHYHNYTYFVFKDIAAGGEILVNYGYQESEDKLVSPDPSVSSIKRDVNWLRKKGRCLDNLKAGHSRISHAGRGAFAVRDLPKGTVVAPVPVLPVRRSSMDLVTERKNGKQKQLVQGKQLLLNYCFGHAESSVLLYPYAPIVNLVNHGGDNANVRLSWSTLTEPHSTGQRWTTDMSVEQVFQQSKSGLLLELISLRDIKRGEEIVLDYGDRWTASWLDHVKEWKPPEGDDEFYAPSYVQDDVIRALRTEKELRSHPYPTNVFTSCFYKYSDNKEAVEKEKLKSSNNKDKNSVTTFRWNQTRSTFELRNLRPCSILQRQNSNKNDNKDGTLFTVRIRNRYGLANKERIPNGDMHIVTHVPRQAIRFSDKIYTTDQHLEGAFRHEIGIPDEMFPEQWKDLTEK